MVTATKKCSICYMEKSIQDYFFKDKSKNRLHSQCKSCYAEKRKGYAKAHYEKYREAYLARAKSRRMLLREEYRNNMMQYLESKCCIHCGETDIRVLEFDHVIPKRKRFTISQAVKLGYSWDEVMEEISHCQILCSNCHKKKTAAEYGWYKL